MKVTKIITNIAHNLILSSNKNVRENREGHLIRLTKMRLKIIKTVT